MTFERNRSPGRRLFHSILVVIGAVAFTVLFFLVLPFIQRISEKETLDTRLDRVDTFEEEAPPDVEEDEPEEPEEEEQKPELAEESPPLDLSQLEMALEPGFGGGGWAGGDFGVKLTSLTSGAGGDVDELFSLSDLDQRPRAIYQPSPVLDAKARDATPGTVYIIFIVDADGRVTNPRIQKSTDPDLARCALTAVKKWKFEPGKRSGKAVRFRMRVPITFPKA